MFGSAVTPHLTNPSGGSSCQEHGAETPKRPRTDAAMAETADRKLFQTTAESLLLCGAPQRAVCAGWHAYYLNVPTQRGTLVLPFPLSQTRQS